MAICEFGSASFQRCCTCSCHRSSERTGLSAGCRLAVANSLAEICLEADRLAARLAYKIAEDRLAELCLGFVVGRIAYKLEVADRPEQVCNLDFEEDTLAELWLELVYKLALADKRAPMVCKMVFVDRPVVPCSPGFVAYTLAVAAGMSLLAEPCNFEVAVHNCFAVAAVASICRRAPVMCTGS